ncbi:hypothetical protein B0H16DRAFT_1837483 [Mycena metata]|uniref:Uncharacterized protein n=1 Tax=Mycena metata TaxID=1033252 RepID=A0AAD7IZ39_9AGAR|nr:hypothetical protein B0H16DRAFT_1837483 [Mycena metata]
MRTRVHIVVAPGARESNERTTYADGWSAARADAVYAYTPPARTGIMAAEGTTYDAHHLSAAPAFDEEQVAKKENRNEMIKEEGEHVPSSSSSPPPPHPFSAGSSSRKRHARCDFEFAAALLFGAANACEHHALSKVEEGVEKMGRAGVVREEVRENGARGGKEKVDAGPRAQR